MIYLNGCLERSASPVQTNTASEVSCGREDNDRFQSYTCALNEVLYGGDEEPGCPGQLTGHQEDFPGKADDEHYVSAWAEDGGEIPQTPRDFSAPWDDGAPHSHQTPDENRDHFFVKHLLSSYLDEISRFPMLSLERERKLARTIKEGQEALVGLIRDKRLEGAGFETLRKQVDRWQGEPAKCFGMPEDMAAHILAALEQDAVEEDIPQERQQLLADVREIAAAVDAAKNEMVRSNLRLVVSIAKRFRGRGLSLLDLIQEGNLGLMKAAMRYDYARGTRFSTYASWWVRQGMMRALYDKTRTIRIPVYVTEMKRLFSKLFHELLRERDREPTIQEIAGRSGLSEDKIATIMQISDQPVSLESPLDSEKHALGDRIVDDDVLSPLEYVLRKELQEVVRQSLASLPSREETILRSHFAIDGAPEETLESIAQRYNVSKERIRQIEQKALAKLRRIPRRNWLGCFLEQER
ncbi:MAG: RNA polymerase sigma factor RpoD/SigA [Syntrophobacteria bacterium]